MSSSRILVAGFALSAIGGCARLARPMDPDPIACPAPDPNGMSQRLADRFFRLSRDSVGRRSLSDQHIDPAQVTEPVFITDRKLCARIAATFGFPKEGAAEGGTFYSSGPYIIYSPWRDYGRRAEWSSTNEFVALLVLDQKMQILGAFAM